MKGNITFNILICVIFSILVGMTTFSITGDFIASVLLADSAYFFAFLLRIVSGAP